MRLSPRTWSLLSLLLFVAAVVFWLKGNDVAEERRSRRPTAPAALPTNGGKVNLLSTQGTNLQLAQLQGGSTGAAAQTAVSEEEIDKNHPYRLRNSARGFNELLRDDHAVLLANALIDTDSGKPVEIPENLRATDDPGSYIVQWNRPVDATFREHLASVGAEIISYVPNNAYLVKVDGARAEALENTPGVQAVLPFEPYYKLQRGLLAAAVEDRPLEIDTLLRLTLMPGAREDGLSEVQSLGGEVLAEEQSPFGPQLIVRAPADSLVAFARLNVVQGIEPDKARIPATDLTRTTLGITTNSSATNSYLGLSGSNIWINFNDGTVDTNHPGLSGQGVYLGHPGMATTDENGHGTFVAGILVGDGDDSSTGTNVWGSSNTVFRGMAPEANLLGLPLELGEVVYPKAADTYLIETAARSNYITFNRTNSLISNNSWTYGNPEYDSSAARYDAAVRDSLPGATGSQPLLFVFAAGNSGFGDDDGFGGFSDTISSPGTAKNVLTIGALESLRLIAAGFTNEVIETNLDGTTTTNQVITSPYIGLTDSDNEVASFSSRGNVGVGIEGTFGRFKPDVVAPGTMMVSARSEGWNVADTIDTNTEPGRTWAELHENLGEYRYDSGTTFSAAAISGMLALVQEYYEAHAPESLRGPLSPALMKALMVNGSRSLTEKYDVTPLKFLNYQGWGLPNLPLLFPTFTTNTHADVEDSHLRLRFSDQHPTNALATGQSKTWMVTLTTNASVFPLRATLVWTDPPGNPNVGVKLVNDLDLVVTNLDTGNVFYGNNIPASGDFSTASQPAEGEPLPTDIINNVENVLIRAPNELGRRFSVTVVGRRVNVNSVTDYYQELSRNEQVRNTNLVVQDFALVVSSDIGADLSLVSETFDPREEEVFETFDAPTTLDIAGGSRLVALTNGLPLLEERVGANASIVGTNGMTNQWSFYVFTNRFIENSLVSITNGSNVAFITFSPPNLARPRNLEADIDLYVSRDPNLTNLAPAVVNAALKGVSREGTESVILSNGTPSDIFYIGVKSEDQQAAEFSLIGLSTDTPFEQDQNGKKILTGIPFSGFLPDGSASAPSASTIIAVGLSDQRIQRVVVTNTVSHENFGDLLGILRHSGNVAVLNNHSLNFGSFFGTNTIIYDETLATPRSQQSDGPGTLNNFVGSKIVGPWILDMIDNAPSHTGRVELLTIAIDPLRDDLLPGVTVSGSVGDAPVYYPIDVPPGVTNMVIRIDLKDPALLEAYIHKGILPTPTNYLVKATNVIGELGFEIEYGLTNEPPLSAGTFYLGLFNPGSGTVDFDLTLRFDYGNVPGDSANLVLPGNMVLDDATTNAVVDVFDDKVVTSAEVAVRMNHSRVSDTVLRLVSPQGTKIVLTENRGANALSGLGMTYLVTNALDTVTTNFGYTIFTEDTNLTQLPIKFARPPFANQTRTSGFVFTNGFEGATNGIYADGDVVDGWDVISNDVSVVTDPGIAAEGTNYLALGIQAAPGLVNVGLTRATATYSQSPVGMFHPAAMIDGNFIDNRGWAIDPMVTNQTAVFETIEPQGFDGGTLLTFRFEFNHVSPAVEQQHTLGRFRLSATTDHTNNFANGFGINGQIGTNWVVLEPVAFRSAAGATLTELSDSSILASGASPQFDVYTVVVHTTLTNITGIRLEALSHPSLPKNGPGRQPSNGNFAISEMSVTAQPADVLGRISRVLPTVAGIEYHLSFVAGNTNFFNANSQVPVTGLIDIDGTVSSFDGQQAWTPNLFTFIAKTNGTPITLWSDSLLVWVDDFRLTESGNSYFLPEESLDFVEGERSLGEWELEMVDARTGETIPVIAPELLSWKLDLTYSRPEVLAEPLIPGSTYPLTINVTQPRLVVPGLLATNQVQYFVVDVCSNVTRATVTLVGAGVTNRGRLELLADGSGLPTGDPERDDYAPILNNEGPAVGTGAAVLILTTNLPPSAPLRPGKRFFLAVRNRFQTETNAYRLRVTFDNSCAPRQSTRLSKNAATSGFLTADEAGDETEGELFAIQVEEEGQTLGINVEGDGDTSFVVQKDVPPTRSSYTYIEDNASASDEELEITTASATPLTPGLWYVLVLNNGSEPVNYSITATGDIVSGNTGEITLATPVIAGGEIELSWNAIAGESYEVQTSVDLENWTTVETVSATGSVATFAAPAGSAPGEARFYRIIQVSE